MRRENGAIFQYFLVDVAAILTFNVTWCLLKRSTDIDNLFCNRLRYPPYNETNVNRLIWLTGKSTKRTPTDPLYFPGLVLGFLGSIGMKVSIYTTTVTPKKDNIMIHVLKR